MSKLLILNILISKFQILNIYPDHARLPTEADPDSPPPPVLPRQSSLLRKIISRWKSYLGKLYPLSRWKSYLVKIISGWKLYLLKIISRWKSFLVKIISRWKSYLVEIISKSYLVKIISRWKLYLVKIISGWKSLPSKEKTVKSQSKAKAILGWKL